MKEKHWSFKCGIWLDLCIKTVLNVGNFTQLFLFEIFLAVDIFFIGNLSIFDNKIYVVH